MICFGVENTHNTENTTAKYYYQSVAMSSLEKRRLGWEPDVALGVVWAVSYSSRLQFALL